MSEVRGRGTPVWKPWEEAVTPEQKAFKRAKAKAQKVYDKALKDAGTTLEEAKVAAQKIFEETMAKALEQLRKEV